jgi:hypothetical protein
MSALADLLSLLEDAQKALAKGLPEGEFGPLIELLDGPRQRQVQSAAREELEGQH